MRVELGGQTREERSRERDETCYNPAFVNHLYRDTGINRKTVFPAYGCSCIYVS
jgi:hypothetical protein